MKRTIVVLLMLIPLLSIAVDPAPPHVTFKLKDDLKHKLAYISLVDSLSCFVRKTPIFRIHDLQFLEFDSEGHCF